MNWQSMILTLAVAVSLNAFISNMKNFLGNLSGPVASIKQSSDIKCTITTDNLEWHVKDKPPVITVKFDFHGAINAPVMPSVRLTALPRKEGIHQNAYWAPFTITTGKSMSEWQKLGFAAEKKQLSISLVPSELLWASTKSSVWPSEAMAKTLLPGEYILQVQLEVSGGKTFVSNEIKILVE
jgi:hypothetical protein